jgi:hypothetical protein
MSRFGVPLDRIRRSSTKEVREVTAEEMKAIFIASGMSAEKAEMQVVVCQGLGSNVLISNIYYSLKK